MFLEIAALAFTFTFTFTFGSGWRFVGRNLEGPRIGAPLHPPYAHPGEERRQCVELLSLPLVRRMVVTVGALNLDAEENSRAFGRQFIGLATVREDQSCLAMIGDGPRGG